VANTATAQRVFHSWWWWRWWWWFRVFFTARC